MKRKVKRFNGEKDSHVETSDKDVEDILADVREEYERRQAAKKSDSKSSTDKDGSDIGSSYMPKSTFKQEAIGNATNDNIQVRKYTPRKKSVAPKKEPPSKTEGLGMAGSDMGSKEKEEKRSSTGAASAAAGTALGVTALLKAMRKFGQDRGEGDLEKAAREREGRAKSGTSLRMPGSRMDKNDPYSMTLGSDLDPKSTMRNRLSGDIDYKKGGKVSSASSRADGIAQRGKTRGKLC